MTAEEFYHKITHIVDDAITFKQSREWSDEFFKELQEEKKIYARLKCLEAIKNVRYRSYDLVGYKVTGDQTIDKILQDIQREIQNIPNQDVMPEL